MAVGQRTRAIWLVFALGLAAVLLYYSLRGIDWRALARTLAAASPLPLIVTVVLGTAALGLRALRWRILLNAEGSVGAATAFWATAAGYFGNNFLPARAGELVRTFMISSRSGLDAAYVLATALSERAADAVALVLIAALVVVTLPNPPGWLAGAARPFALLALAAVAAIAVLPLLGGAGRSLLERLSMPPALRARLMAATAHALRGMRAFHDGRRLAGFAALTAIIWTLDAIGSVAAARALGLHMPLSAAFLLLASLGLGSALPSTPGYVGIFQFVAVTVLLPFGFSRTDAIAYILVAQAMGYIVIGFWGALGLIRYRRAQRPT